MPVVFWMNLNPKQKGPDESDPYHLLLLMMAVKLTLAGKP